MVYLYCLSPDTFELNFIDKKFRIANLRNFLDKFIFVMHQFETDFLFCMNFAVFTSLN